MFIHHLFITFLVIALPPSFAISNCDRVCKGNNQKTAVPYPFGFSDGCNIRLECTKAGEIHISKYQVSNITSDHILVFFPANCTRPYQEIRRFRSESYAITSRNELILRNCSRGTSNECLLSTSMVQSQFNLPTCDIMGNTNISCYNSDNGNISHADVEFMNTVELEMKGCRVLYSSIVIDLDKEKRSLVTMGFQAMELGWWMQGDCSCHHKAVCKNVSIDNARVGYRCNCVDGYDGDGFVAGNGCRKVSNCNFSKYMSGECGGTTRVVVLIAGIIAGASFVATITLICYCIRKRMILRNQMSAKRLLSEATGSFNVPSYSYKEIERATNGFSEKQMLGTGAYGTVYAGKLNNCDWVAIKKIRQIEAHGMDQVMNEIKLLSSVSHPNLVRLLGFCIEKGEQILVYEFMPNGTLSQHLQRERGKGLPWTIRLAIATETAQAIAYLHSAMNPPIYHRDIKSSNILLDHKYRSKVADFGLSRLGMLDESHISTAPQGTPGYVDPQYHQNFHLSDKSDVYSFGVVLVEIITALKVVDLSRRNSEVNLAALAIDKIGKGHIDEMIDPFLEPNRDAWTISSIHKVAELAFRCLAFHGDVRPSMMEVADELDQIKQRAWSQCDDNISKRSFSVASSSSSLYSGGEKKGSRRFVVPQMITSCLTTRKDKDTSQVSVEASCLSDQSSPSTNSLLGNIVS
uniref:wall-associated receptor kinase-like 14 n=1 Tax=Erigeron canadensis TaxID=72917 RepID=UPI001CB9A6CE|nr:wall-associated receptor kinase-like 14 [Erigeron canadensis]XP_043631248.1 wall-associated receptor kinase-like 14 [Erigeron canadensis]